MVHNGYLQMAVTNGWRRSVFYLALMTSILWLLLRTILAAGSPATRWSGSSTSTHWRRVHRRDRQYLVQDLSGWQEILVVGVFLAVARRGRLISPQSRNPTGPCDHVRPCGRRWSVGAARGGTSCRFDCGGVSCRRDRFPSHRDLSRCARTVCSSETLGLDPSRDWPRIEQDLETSLRLVPRRSVLSGCRRSSIPEAAAGNEAATGVRQGSRSLR